MPERSRSRHSGCDSPTSYDPTPDRSSPLRVGSNIDSPLGSVGFQDERDGLGEAVPLTRFLHEAFAPGCREEVEPRPTIVRRHTPLPTNPATRLEPLQCGIEGAVLDE